MIGYNDLPNRTDDEIVDNIDKIIASVPGKRIYLQSLLPIRDDGKGTNARIMAINARLKKVALSRGCAYIDLHAHFLGAGQEIRPELTRDGVHPNFWGYRLWYALVAPLL